MTFPWDEADDLGAADLEAIAQLVPTAWLGRTSDEEQQDPTLSLPRQLRSARDALPPSYPIVAHFYDVESGRLALDERGQGSAHELFDIPIPRDGGIQDLLDEARSPDRRFVAVICENIERVARRTYFSTRIEYELEQAGVLLLAADEPIPDLAGPRRGRAPKRSSAVLNRRVKQGIAEWYVLNLLEQSWDGTAEHTEQGWNIGKPCYGYRALRVPHPVPAKRAEGRTKARLVPHAIEGPTVTRIFHLRYVQRLGYDPIAAALNTDLEAHPPPTPVNPARALGRWSGSSVREVLTNPKYTGYMVWNRRATSSKKGKVNPPHLWVWSPQPTHEPLVTKEVFSAVTEMARARQGSRAGSAPNSHPETRRTYELRSYMFCDPCVRRMEGRSNRGRSYYVCRPDRHYHPEARDRCTRHPAAVWVREEDLLDLTHAFFAAHVFGPRRQEALRTPAEGEPQANPIAVRLRAELADLAKRRRNVLTQMEEYEPTGDDDIDHECRAELRHRHADLARQHKLKAEQLAALATPAPEPDDDPTLLDALPVLTGADLTVIPEELLRDLYENFNLEVRYHPDDHTVTIRVTVRDDRLPAIHTALHQATSSTHPPQPQKHPMRPALPGRTDAPGTPNGI